MLTKLLDCLNKNEILTSDQHGYKQRHSTETASVSLLECIYRSLDEGQQVAAVFFDMTKAFDCINIDFALQKLDALGIRGRVLEWLETYLRNRKIAVKLGDTISECAVMEHGVGQGSVLGPFIFTIFVNDLPAHVDGKVVLYADDGAVVVVADSDEELHNKVLQIISQFEQWCCRNDLALNTSKTSLVRFCTKQRYLRPLELRYNGDNLKALTTVKYLGTYIDADLTWNGQTEHLAKTISKNIYLLINLKNLVSQEHLLQIYFALFQSVLSYNIVLWGSGVNNINRLFILQKRALRVIFNLGPSESCRDIFKSYNIMTLPGLYIYNCIKLVYNSDNVSDLGDTHNYFSRHRDQIKFDKHRTMTFEKSPLYSGKKFTNKLHKNFKNVSKQLFLRDAKRYILGSCPYSVSEFMNQ